MGFWTDRKARQWLDELWMIKDHVRRSDMQFLRRLDRKLMAKRSIGDGDFGRLSRIVHYAGREHWIKCGRDTLLQRIRTRDSSYEYRDLLEKMWLADN